MCHDLRFHLGVAIWLNFSQVTRENWKIPVLLTFQWRLPVRSEHAHEAPKGRLRRFERFRNQNITKTKHSNSSAGCLRMVQRKTQHERIDSTFCRYDPNAATSHWKCWENSAVSFTSDLMKLWYTSAIWGHNPFPPVWRPDALLFRVILTENSRLCFGWPWFLRDNNPCTNCQYENLGRPWGKFTAQQCRHLWAFLRWSVFFAPLLHANVIIPIRDVEVNKQSKGSQLQTPYNILLKENAGDSQ